MIKKVVFIVCILQMNVVFGFQSIDTLKVNSDRLLMNELSAGQARYLVYIEFPDGSLKDISIWERKVSVKDEKVMIFQQWKNQDVSKTRELFSVSRLKNFEPIYHSTKNGKGVVEAFEFYPHTIKGADSVTNNSRKDFSLILKEKTFNWELDIEMLQTLPYELGKTFVINFYHPGSKKLPAYYQYKVLSLEDILHSNGEKTRCWVVEIVYSKNNKATFWIDVKHKKMLRMEESFGKIKRLKIKI